MTEATAGIDVVDELTADHRDAAELLDEILNTADPATRRDLADTVITELVRHSVAEERCDTDDPQFDQLVRQLREQLHHHATDEESDQFPKLRAHVSREKLVQMRKQVETAKKIAPTRPHPNAPNN